MCNIYKYIFWTSTTNTLQHLSCHAAAVQHCRCHHRHCAATGITMLPCCCHQTAATATLLLPRHCCLRHRVATKLPPLPLPPRCCHRRCHCQAATVAAKLPLLPLSTLWDRFDDEKEWCKMTDIDFFWLSWLFQLGVEFLHGGMLSIFDALVYLSINCFNL